MAEEWRPIPAYNGIYSVSDRGRVRREGGTPRRPKTQVRKTYIAKNGYPSISLWMNNEGRTHCVHWLVAEAFLGPKPEGHQVNHKDGDKTNNKPTNLEYVTAKGNSDHAWDMGLTDNRGERHGMSKLTDAHARRIAERLIAEPEATYADIARDEGISTAVVGDIAARKKAGWRHVTEDLADALLARRRLRRPRAGLNEAEIIARRKAGESIKTLTDEYGVSRRTIYRVLNGK